MTAWAEDLVGEHTVRKALHNAPTPRIPETATLLRQRAPGDQAVLARQICGAYQTGARKKHWAGSDQCQWCDQPDDNYHRLTACPAFSTVYQRHPEVHARLQECHPVIGDLPILFTDTEETFMHAINWHHQQDTIDPQHLREAHKLAQAGQWPHWYSDGSCTAPTQVYRAQASFAIGLDATADDNQRTAIAAMLEDGMAAPPTTRCSLVARVQGEQTSTRAELTAAVILAESQAPGILHCDSQTVVDGFRLCQNTQDVRTLAKREHWDLWKRLWHALQESPLHIAKIKAHQSWSQHADLGTRYHAIGNHWVDKWAGKIVHPASSPFAKKWHDHAKEMQQAQSETSQLHDFLIDLNRYRMAMPDPAANQEHEVVADGIQVKNPAHVIELFKAWQIPQPVHLDLEGTIEPIFDSFTYGGNHGRAIWAWLWAWLRHVRIPTNTSGPTGIAAGTSWLELSLSYVAFTGQWIPVIRNHRWFVALACKWMHLFMSALVLTYGGTCLQRISPS